MRKPKHADITHILKAAVSDTHSPELPASRATPTTPTTPVRRAPFVPRVESALWTAFLILLALFLLVFVVRL